MKHKIIICTAMISFAFCETSLAQSSSLGTNNSNENKTIIVEGKKFPMTAAEYNIQKNIDQEKKKQQDLQQKQPVGTAIPASFVTLPLEGNTVATPTVAPSPAVLSKMQETTIAPAKAVQPDASAIPAVLPAAKAPVVPMQTVKAKE